MQELENKKAALELLQNETNDKLNDYKQQISILQKQIDDYNKPALTHSDGTINLINLNHSYNHSQIDWYDEGSALNLIKKQNL